MTTTETLSSAPSRSRFEFIAIATAGTTLAALAIDTALPAFSDLRSHYQLGADSTRASWVVNLFLLGMALGALLFGTLSDRFGRKPLLVGALVLYVVAGAVAASAPNLTVLFVARFVWGFAAAGPRAVSTAMIRDRFAGEAMARIMSLMAAAFMLVPVLAPTLGAGLNAIGPWQLVFWVPAAGGAVVAVWASLRLPETLPIESRRSVGPAALAEAGRAIVRSRQTVGFTIVMTLLFGMMSSFLSGLEIIVKDVFNHKALFPAVFGGVSLLMMSANYLNARLVTKRGMARMLHIGAMAMLATSAMFAAFVVISPRHPNLLVFCVLLACVQAAQSLVFPNANTTAMAAVGHVAGAAASVIAFVSTAGGAVIGWLVSGAFNGTARPFAISFAILGALTALAVWRTLRDQSNPVLA
jgi:MFS transporter, DHA1 family, multidrug resistance protein